MDEFLLNQQYPKEYLSSHLFKKYFQITKFMFRNPKEINANYLKWGEKSFL